MRLQDIKKAKKREKTANVLFLLIQILNIVSGIGFKFNNPKEGFCHIMKYSQICILNKTLTIWKKSELPL